MNNYIPSCYMVAITYPQTSNIIRMLPWNKIVDYSDVVGAAPVGNGSLWNAALLHRLSYKMRDREDTLCYWTFRSHFSLGIVVRCVFVVICLSMSLIRLAILHYHIFIQTPPNNNYDFHIFGLRCVTSVPAFCFTTYVSLIPPGFLFSPLFALSIHSCGMKSNKFHC